MPARPASTNYEIRPYSPDMLDARVQMQHAFDYELLTTLGMPDGEAELFAARSEDTHHAWLESWGHHDPTQADRRYHQVILVGDQLRGLCVAYKAGDDNGSLNSLNSIYVAPELRGTHAAERLVGDFLSGAANPTLSTEVEVDELNTRAKHFYRKLGFTTEYDRTTEQIGSITTQKIFLHRQPKEHP